MISSLMKCQHFWKKIKSASKIKAALCHETDKAALLDFKNKITEDPSNLLQTWNQSTDCCTQWDGVGCDHSGGRVVNFSRPGVYPDDYEWYADLHGTISPSLGNLQFLTVLDLTSLTFLTGSIPSELGKLSHLTILSRAGNRLNGTIPVSFKNLCKLNQLSLSSNILSGSVYNFIFQDMSSLTYLDLSENQLSGEIPSSVVKLVSLQQLDLHQNNFSGAIPSEIGSLKGLIDLKLSDNQLSGIIPISIGELSKLDWLDLSRNRLSGNIPSSIKATFFYILSIEKYPTVLAILQILSLKNNRFTGKITSELAKLKHLEILDLSFNPLNLVNIPTWLSEMKNLLQLHLAGTGLVGELPEWLTTMGLEYLDVSSNALSGEIGNMRSLYSLNLSSNSFHSAIPVEFKTF
ncbi:MDIS1-interacting receptor like kinase 1-like [Papaver somniferum]|uniref:MDIS1-interacting receptor like kinase 1-like n=1 Tax=Papaver somniferum TaxID=3469 RepID=UPI000E6FDD62|nr:MDIS1-interacting receptor like kinase 1-like [Papaver somniferum]